MKKLVSLIAKGLMAVLPLGLTIYAVVWLLLTMEQLTREALLLVLPDNWYFPGFGLISALVILCVIGLMMNVYGARYLLDLSERVMQKIPLAKSVYASVKDIITVFKLGKDSDMRGVVRVDMGNDVYLIGFVTGQAAGEKLFPGEDRVGVYMPMSYQIGGYTKYLPRERLKPLDISVEEAMRLTLTGGSQAPQK